MTLYVMVTNSIKRWLNRLLFFDFGSGIDFLKSTLPWSEVEYRQEKYHHPFIQEMLNDRPKMASILKNQIHLIRWFSSQFLGKETKFQIRWDSEEPETSSAAEHKCPQDNKSAYIRVSNQISGIDQLAVAIYELFNIRFTKEYKKLWTDAWKGKVCRKDFDNTCNQQEHRAMMQSRRFIEGHFLVFLEASKDDTKYQWILHCPSSYKVYKMQIHCNRKTYFEKIYDNTVMPHLKSISHCNKGSRVCIQCGEDIEEQFEVIS